MNLVQEDDALPIAGLGLRVGPESFPVPRHAGFGGIGGSIERGVAVARGQIEQERGLPDLAGSRQQLNAAWCRFIEAFEQPCANVTRVGR